jgi:rubredoxin
MPKHERQCQVCGLIYDLNYWAPEDTWVCHYCKRPKVKTDNKAMISLKRMKKKLGAKAS